MNLDGKLLSSNTLGPEPPPTKLIPLSHNHPSATDCDPVPTITNGRVDTTSAKVRVGDGVTVVCDEHYQLSHTDIPTCITNELYDPTLPSCNGR